MTEPKSSIPFASSQANSGPSPGPPFPEHDPYSGHDVGDPASGSSLYGPQWALCVSTSRALGLEAGIFVRQLGHWLVEVQTGGTFEDDRRWIWRTYHDWAEEFGWWEWWEIRDRVLPSVPEGVVLKKGAWRNGRKTTLYSLDFHELDRLIRKAGQDPPMWVGLGIDRDRSQPIQTNFDHVVDKESGSTTFMPSPDKDSESATFVSAADKESESTTFIDPQDEESESTTFNESDAATNKESESTAFPLYKDNNQRKHTEQKLASSGRQEVSEQDYPWARAVGVDDEPQTFLERVWTLYCDNYDDAESISLDDRRWRPLTEVIVEWQREHRALVDPSRAEQLFDSITTTNPREPIGLIFAVFRDELSGRHDLDTLYEPPFRAGLRRMAGRY